MHIMPLGEERTSCRPKSSSSFDPWF